VTKDLAARLALDAEVDFGAAESTEAMRKQFRRFERLLADDTDDYGTAENGGAAAPKLRKSRARHSAPAPLQGADPGTCLPPRAVRAEVCRVLWVRGVNDRPSLLGHAVTPTKKPRALPKAATAVKRKRKRKVVTSSDDDD